jgi:SAM-dependent methyltransferase
VQELFRQLAPGARVLDLGADQGSFDAAACPGQVVRIDLENPRYPIGGEFSRADAAALPFADGVFALVISNHSLEHFDRLEAALAEVKRVLAPGGSFYVAVPDASTVTDRVYRWLARGGGHVNAFTSLAQVRSIVEQCTRLRMESARVLCTSLSFLNRRNFPPRHPRRLWLFGNGNEVVLRWLTLLFRLSDRWLRTRASVYGWRAVFRAGEMREGKCDAPWTNVCVRCGSGHPCSRLQELGLVSGQWWRRFACPTCRAVNYYTDDSRYSKLR